MNSDSRLIAGMMDPAFTETIKKTVRFNDIESVKVHLHMGEEDQPILMFTTDRGLFGVSVPMPDEDTQVH